MSIKMSKKHVPQNYIITSLHNWPWYQSYYHIPYMHWSVRQTQQFAKKTKTC
jgi:hypothetical protein